MKRISLTIIVFLTIGFAKLQGQTETELELLKTKQKLLEAEIELIKAKISNQRKSNDSLEWIKQKLEDIEFSLTSSQSSPYDYSRDSIVIKPYDLSWEFNFLRLFEGGIEISCEKLLKNNKSALNVSLIGNYADKKGIGQSYVDDYNYTESIANSNYSWTHQADKMYGGGIELKWKHYLLANKKVYRYGGWHGLYVTPSIMYRAIVYEGEKTVNIYDLYNSYYKKEDFSNTLNILKLAFHFGNRNVISDVFTIDYYIGGAFRFSEYAKEDLNDYSNWVDLDYTGIMPVAGIKLGFIGKK